MNNWQELQEGWIGRVFDLETVSTLRGGYTAHVCDNPLSGQAQRCTPVKPGLRNLSWTDSEFIFTIETMSPTLTTGNRVTCGGNCAPCY